MPHNTFCWVSPLRLRLISGLASNLAFATTPSDAGCPDGSLAKMCFPAEKRGLNMPTRALEERQGGLPRRLCFPGHPPCRELGEKMGKNSPRRRKRAEHGEKTAEISPETRKRADSARKRAKTRRKPQDSPYFLINRTHSEPTTRNPAATRNIAGWLEPTRLMTRPPVAAATICGRQMVQLNRPR